MDRTIIDVMAEFFTAHPDHGPRSLHVAEPVWRFLRDRFATAIPREAAAAMLDLPVVVDDDLAGGRWEIRNGAEVVSSGDMAPAPEGMTAHYSPHVGWFAVSPEAADPLAFPRWTSR